MFINQIVWMVMVWFGLVQKISILMDQWGLNVIGMYILLIMSVSYYLINKIFLFGIGRIQMEGFRLKRIMILLFLKIVTHLQNGEPLSYGYGKFRKKYDVLFGYVWKIEFLPGIIY